MSGPTVLVFRTCNKDLTSFGGFQWPESGPVECPPPDPNKSGARWDPKPACGNGLHGWLWGEGHSHLADWSQSAKWLVVEVLESDIVDLGGKVKFPKGNVVFCGSRWAAANYIKENGGLNKRVIGAYTSVADDCKAITGDKGMSMAGKGGYAISGWHGVAITGSHGMAKTKGQGRSYAGVRGTAETGHHGTAQAGSHGTAQAGSHGKAVVGDYGRAITQEYGTSIAGDYGISQTGNDGTATAGDYGTAAAGKGGTAAVGAYGTARVEDPGTAQAGEGGQIIIQHVKGGRSRTLVGYVGEAGILPDTPYRVVYGSFVAVTDSEKES